MSGGQIPQVITNYLTFLGSAALPIAVLCVGAALDLKALRRPGPALTSALLIRNMLAPAIALCFVLILGLDEIAATIAVLVFAVPSAGASFVLAKKNGRRRHVDGRNFDPSNGRRRNHYSRMVGGRGLLDRVKPLQNTRGVIPRIQHAIA